MTTSIPSAPPARILHFDVYLVLPDAATRQLRVSPQTGDLSVNTTDRIVLFAYKRKKGNFLRTLHAPSKCVVASLGLQLWSRISKSTVRCRFVSERDKECCLEVLQIMGVRVLDVRPTRFILQQSLDKQHGDQDIAPYAAQFESLSAVLAHPTLSRDIVSCVTSYQISDQLPSDIAVISQAFFGGSVFDP